MNKGITCYLLLRDSNDHQYYNFHTNAISFRSNPLIVEREKGDIEEKDYFGWKCTLPCLPHRGDGIEFTSMLPDMVAQWQEKARKGHESILTFLETMKSKPKCDIYTKDKFGTTYPNDTIIKNIILDVEVDEDDSRKEDLWYTPYPISHSSMIVGSVWGEYDRPGSAICIPANKDYVYIEVVLEF